MNPPSAADHLQRTLYYMGGYKINIFFLALLFQFSNFYSVSTALENNFDQSLDDILHDYGSRIMSRHTDKLYNASLPEYLAGIQISVVKLRSRTLWRKGANFSDFILPPRTLPVPYTKRLLIVYHNLGNQSSLYYTISGYTFLSPVVGFMVYDAKELTKIRLNTNGNPVSIEFHGQSLAYQRKKCAKFGDYGKVLFSDVRFPNRCYSTTPGHFSIVIPFMKKRNISQYWAVGFFGGFLGLVLVGFGVAVGMRSLMSKRNQEMETGADGGECLETYWVDSSKMPRAEVTRTKPALEGTTSLPNPKPSLYA